MSDKRPFEDKSLMMSDAPEVVIQPDRTMFVSDEAHRQFLRALQSFRTKQEDLEAVLERCNKLTPSLGGDATKVRVASELQSAINEVTTLWGPLSHKYYSSTPVPVDRRNRPLLAPRDPGRYRAYSEWWADFAEGVRELLEDAKGFLSVLPAAMSV